LVTKSAIRPGSNFNRQGGSIFHQRQQPWRAYRAVLTLLASNRQHGAEVVTEVPPQRHKGSIWRASIHGDLPCCDDERLCMAMRHYQPKWSSYTPVRNHIEARTLHFLCIHIYQNVLVLNPEGG
ncbi:hypothetical protein, partial [Pseudomonas aeruginosa]|uniref:hypothetical protein n=1 Tax=Pseudomonas aeruginosa TaxID=287 RepID=UPI003AFB145A